jgi:hypothetical protein
LATSGIDAPALTDKGAAVPGAGATSPHLASASASASTPLNELDLRLIFNSLQVCIGLIALLIDRLVEKNFVIFRMGEQPRHCHRNDCEDRYG